MLFEEPNLLKYYNEEKKEFDNRENEGFWWNLIFEKFIWIKELVNRNALYSKY